MEQLTSFPAVFLHFSGNVRFGSSILYSFRNAEVRYGLTSSLLENVLSMLVNWFGGMSPVFILKLLIRVLFYTKRQSVQTGRSEKRKKKCSDNYRGVLFLLRMIMLDQDFHLLDQSSSMDLYFPCNLLHIIKLSGLHKNHKKLNWQVNWFVSFIEFCYY